MDSLLSDSRCKLNNRIVISNIINNKKINTKFIVKSIKFFVSISPKTNTKTIDNASLKKVEPSTAKTLCFWFKKTFMFMYLKTKSKIKLKKTI